MAALLTMGPSSRTGDLSDHYVIEIVYLGLLCRESQERSDKISIL